MSKKKQKIGKEFNQLQTKIFISTFGIFAVAVVLCLGIYSYILSGHIANMFVRFFMLFTQDYDEALIIYQNTIRNYTSLFVMLAVFFIFAVAIRIYLKQFTKYFNEINQGINALAEEDAQDIKLSTELAPVERKINGIKHTLEHQKRAAKEAEQRKNDLVVYLAHDLKTPLTSVIGYLTLLHDEQQISEELRKKYLGISLDKAEHLEDLINEFFEITRFNLSNITLEYSRVNLTRMFEQLVFEFKPMFLEKNLNCELQIAPDLMVKCDVNKMQRVFDNLLRNAVNYSFEDSTIHITVMQNDSQVNIKFTNSGNTIPPEKLSRIFEQFYRLDTARSSRSGGAGLGLAIAKQIVELHGGTITAKSENEIIEFEIEMPVES